MTFSFLVRLFVLDTIRRGRDLPYAPHVLRALSALSAEGWIVRVGASWHIAPTYGYSPSAELWVPVQASERAPWELESEYNARHDAEVERWASERADIRRQSLAEEKDQETRGPDFFDDDGPRYYGFSGGEDFARGT